MPVPPGAPEVSVVVPCAGRGEHLDEQLTALAGQTTRRPWELVVADNGMDAAALAAVRRRFPAAVVTDVRDRPGSAAVRTLGAAAASADRVLFCDADDVVDAGWLEAMTAALDGLDAVGGRLRYDVLNPPALVDALPLRLQEAGLPTLYGDVPYVLSCSLGVRRSAFDAVGGFDAALPIGGGEDVDLGWRLHAAGAAVGFAADALVDYRLRAGLRGRLRQQRAYGRGNALLRIKHRGSIPPLRPAEVAGTLARVVSGSRYLFAGRRRRESWLCWAAYVGAEYTTLARRR